jgi:hypothetical protein
MFHHSESITPFVSFQSSQKLQKYQHSIYFRDTCSKLVLSLHAYVLVYRRFLYLILSPTLSVSVRCSQLNLVLTLGLEVDRFILSFLSKMRLFTFLAQAYWSMEYLKYAARGRQI